jgi:hypothetical protein
VSILLADLKHPGLELQLTREEWDRIRRLLCAMDISEGWALAQTQWSTRIEVTIDAARKIGTRLEQKFFNDMRELAMTPTIPDYIRPIATSNGLWIDAALPLLNRPTDDYFYLKFANFCQVCSGFSIS